MLIPRRVWIAIAIAMLAAILACIISSAYFVWPASFDATRGCQTFHNCEHAIFDRNTEIREETNYTTLLSHVSDRAFGLRNFDLNLFDDEVARTFPQIGGHSGAYFIDMEFAPYDGPKGCCYVREPYSYSEIDISALTVRETPHGDGGKLQLSGFIAPAPIGGDTTLSPDTIISPSTFRSPDDNHPGPSLAVTSDADLPSFDPCVTDSCRDGSDGSDGPSPISEPSQLVVLCVGVVVVLMRSMTRKRTSTFRLMDKPFGNLRRREISD